MYEEFVLFVTQSLSNIVHLFLYLFFFLVVELLPKSIGMDLVHSTNYIAFDGIDGLYFIHSFFY
jgi:hypothetical protein